MRRTTLFVAIVAVIATTGCGDDTGDGGTTGAGNASNGGQGAGGEATGGGGAGGTGNGGEGAGGASGLLPFGADCTEDEECETGLCYPFGMGPKCSVLCPPDPADCPGPLKECNNMDPAACKV